MKLKFTFHACTYNYLYIIIIIIIILYYICFNTNKKYK